VRVSAREVIQRVTAATVSGIVVVVAVTVAIIVVVVVVGIVIAHHHKLGEHERGLV
jgi:hypothetical protein